MNKTDGTLEKLLTIEKAVNEMVTLRQGIAELKESEAQRQKALEDCRQVESRYETLLRNLAPKLFLKDPNSVYLLCNPSYVAGLKITPEDIFGKTDYDLYPADLAEKYVADDRRVLDSGRPEMIEETLAGDGQPLTFSTVKSPVKDEKGDTIGILGISWDISEQKRKEADLQKRCQELEESVSALMAELQWKGKLFEREMAARRECEERLRGAEGLRSLVEKVAVPVVLIEENMISLVNREFERLSGYSPEEVEGKMAWTEFFPRAEEVRIAEALGNTGENPPPMIRERECQFRDKQGNLREVAVTLSSIPGTRRRVASLMDISDSRHIEERIQEMEEIFECLAENTNEALVILQEGRVRFANPKMAEILGYSSEELISQPFRELVFPEDRGVAENCGENSGAGERGRPCSFRMVGKDGRVHWLEVKSGIIEWEKKPAVLNILTDMTLKRQAGEELRSSLVPFQTLAKALDKCFLAVNGNPGKSETGEGNGTAEERQAFLPPSLL